VIPTEFKGLADVGSLDSRQKSYSLTKQYQAVKLTYLGEKSPARPGEMKNIE
jgi:hypothetical protein